VIGELRSLVVAFFNFVLLNPPMESSRASLSKVTIFGDLGSVVDVLIAGGLGSGGGGGESAAG